MQTQRLIDTHCHLDAPEFDADREALIAQARTAGVTGWIIPAVERRLFEGARDCAYRIPGGAYALGLHPMAVPRACDEDLQVLEQALRVAAADDHCVAVGEIGLDDFDADARAQFSKQEAYFAAQLDLAAANKLPVIVHSRRAVDKVLMHLRRSGVRCGCLHAFNGSQAQARRALDLGMVLGFGGAMTYERALQIRRLARFLPDDAVVLETDAPDIPPAWDRHARTLPAALARYAHTLAALRGVSVDAIGAQCTHNTLRIFPRMARLLPNSPSP